MKKSKYLKLMAFISSLALLTACGGGGGGGDGGGGTSTTNTSGSGVMDYSGYPTYPTSADAYEGAGGDNTIATASAINIGESQYRTLWNAGDVDYIKVNLTAGYFYEFSANHLCTTCDTRMFLYGTDGTTLQDFNDNYIYKDSMIFFRPSTTGTYYLKVNSFSSYDVASYVLNADIYTASTDKDWDGYSRYHDCDENNKTIYPWATEIVGDGISQNCSGTDKLASTTPDSFEPDNTTADAKILRMTDISVGEIQFQQAAWAQNARTIHAAGERDYFTITLAPKEAAMLGMHNVKDGATTDLLTKVIDSDGTTVLQSMSTTWPWFYIANNNNASKTYYVSFEAADGVSTTWYVPSLYSIGVDLDNDGYHTRDSGNARDCNDSDPSIHPGISVVETANDGIDSNCNGNDNT